jgi:hypothetical protein
LPWNNYSAPVQAWLDAFPRRQLLLLQYERLTDPDQEAAHLHIVKRWAAQAGRRGVPSRGLGLDCISRL